jgi:adenosylcobinamide-GDP ribazoletransferase
MKRIFAALTFLTRLPLPKNWMFGAEEIGRSTAVFPLIGAMFGGISWLILKLFLWFEIGQKPLESLLIAALIITVSVRITGALHVDGLADMADGFGGGRDKKRILEIMRDSVIGTFGGVALILLFALKIIAIGILIERGKAESFLLISPIMARWATVPLGKFLPYARSEGGLGQSVTDFVGWTELIAATLITAIFAFVFANSNGFICWLIVCISTVYIANLCLRKIGGITGDTMGANSEISETVVFLTAIFLTK